jgi:adenylate cyclase
MADVIMEFRGTIDEFIGDAILVIFGAPIVRPDDARRAVACAVAMQRAMEQVNEHNRTHGLPDVEMGIAVNTGEVVVGNIGSTKRAKYGVVGTPINLTSRIETYTVGGQVLIAQATLDAAGPDVVTAGTVEVKAKGARAPITAHYVRGIGGEFDLMLPELHEHAVVLSPEVPLTYFLVEGKAVSDVGVPATLARITEKGGDVRAEVEIPPLTNVKLRFEGVPEDIYAKVVPPREGRPPGFSIHFTSIPPTAEALLRTLRPSH